MNNNKNAKILCHQYYLQVTKINLVVGKYYKNSFRFEYHLISRKCYESTVYEDISCKWFRVK